MDHFSYATGVEKGGKPQRSKDPRLNHTRPGFLGSLCIFFGAGKGIVLICCGVCSFPDIEGGISKEFSEERKPFG